MTPNMPQNAFLASLSEKYGSEVAALLPEWGKRVSALRQLGVERYPNIRIGADGKTTGTVTLVDCQILYLLVRHIKPQNVFEIGTWIGTSAMVIADAMKVNGHGHLYTCDFNSYYCLDASYNNYITTLTGMSDKVLGAVPTAVQFDLIFADGELTFPTLTALAPRLTKDTVLVTHDYTLPAEKGVRNLIRWQLKNKALSTPILNPTLKAGAHTSIAILAPASLMLSVGLLPYSRLRSLIHLFYRAVTTYTFLTLRRILRIAIK